jgi:hypothetical protein
MCHPPRIAGDAGSAESGLKVIRLSPFVMVTVTSTLGLMLARNETPFADMGDAQAAGDDAKLATDVVEERRPVAGERVLGERVLGDRGRKLYGAGVGDDADAAAAVGVLVENALASNAMASDDHCDESVAANVNSALISASFSTCAASHRLKDLTAIQGIGTCR